LWRSWRRPIGERRRPVCCQAGRERVPSGVSEPTFYNWPACGTQAVEVGRSMPSEQVKAVLAALFAERGLPEYIRSDNRPEFIAHELGDWLTEMGVRTHPIAPERPPACRADREHGQPAVHHRSRRTGGRGGTRPTSRVSAYLPAAGRSVVRGWGARQLLLPSVIVCRS